jgi:uncharacterized membrane protein (DUF106 family)
LRKRHTLAPTMTSVKALHVVKGVVLLSLGVLTGLIAQQIKKRLLDSFKLAEERNEVANTFGQHVSPAVARA